jgi:hypothetical protein
MQRISITLVLLIIYASIGGCAAHYVTPGGGVSLAGISDNDIEKAYARKPASAFPANLAVIRIQDQGYVSRTYHGQSLGRYTVVTTRDIESVEAIEILQHLPLIAGIAPIGRLLLSPSASNIKDLRLSAAQLQADLLLVYSVDTSFVVDGTPLGPLSVISLGLIPNKKAHVTATVAGIVIDVRTGFVYGTTEASTTEHQRATVWSTQDATDAARIKAEAGAFDAFVVEFQGFWTDMVNVYAASGSPLVPASPPGNRYYKVDLKNP